MEKYETDIIKERLFMWVMGLPIVMITNPMIFVGWTGWHVGKTIAELDKEEKRRERNRWNETATQRQKLDRLRRDVNVILLNFPLNLTEIEKEMLNKDHSLIKTSKYGTWVKDKEKGSIYWLIVRGAKNGNLEDVIQKLQDGKL